ncbi:MAG TPA: threonine--tRNA ligase [Candidatus Bathyarchaeia archaeon]|nr:threonine--tRNA ligase [Candidatus Bathyarchaeia archaeon]
MPKIDLKKIRHSCSHLLATAIQDLYPKTRFGIGPAIEQGFYYDFDLPQKISENDLVKIEKKMKALAKKNLKFEKKEVKIDEAEEMMKKAGQPYKAELVKELKKEGKKKVIFYKLGDFIDLCEGPHLKSTKEIGSFKLLSVAGAYWRGSEKNPMLTRIYGTCFESKNALEKHLVHREEAKRRNHRKIGKNLDLFTFSDLVGPGLPLYTEKGTIIINELYKALLEISKKYGVQEVRIPHMAKIDLYKISGHAEKFKGELLRVKSHYGLEFILKPVNCPHHTQIYASRPRSYRDLPIRYIESTAQHRDEKPGEIGGLTRTRSFIVDDGHTFCTMDQIKQEAINTCKIIEEFYKGAGLWGNQWISLSIRDPKTPEKYIGEEPDWKKAEKMVQEISNELKLKGKVMVGEAAIYGPKIDYMSKDSLGNDHQLGTVQIDFAMPKRFGLTYVDKDGKEKTPVMLHRAIMGSYERFIAFLLEHFDGALPVWLSPVQVAVIPITDNHNPYAQKIHQSLIEAGIRAELNDRSNTVSAKIRDAEIQKIPYMLIVGDREVRAKKVNVRTRGEKVLGTMSLGAFLKRISQDIDKKRPV